MYCKLVRLNTCWLVVRRSAKRSMAQRVVMAGVGGRQLPVDKGACRSGEAAVRAVTGLCVSYHDNNKTYKKNWLLYLLYLANCAWLPLV